MVEDRVKWVKFDFKHQNGPTIEKRWVVMQVGTSHSGGYEHISAQFLTLSSDSV